ncbi:MAG TPA: ABC transporter ATP-binding protein [Methylophilus sp.]|nr:ABC transporter ATP-binding protein [Methylophilus sp.]
MDEPVIDVRGLYKSYPTAGGADVPVLKDVNLMIRPGEYLVIMGPSGSGKSTFMNVLGCLDKPTHGEYYLNGHPTSKMDSDELAGLRNQTLGFVFQGFNLLPRSTLLDNVALPLVYAGVKKNIRSSAARLLLERVGLARYCDAKPSQISGGQQQRVAIARALVNNPKIILADEPTGNLDSKTSEEIMSIFDQLNQDGITILLVTHESDIASHAKRKIRFLDGRIISDSQSCLLDSAC